MPILFLYNTIGPRYFWADFAAMNTSKIRILYRGRAGRTSKLLADLLTSAGYAVTAESRADQDIVPDAADLVIVSPPPPRSGDRRGAETPRRAGRTIVLTAEAAAPAGRDRPPRRANRAAMNLQQLRAHVRQTQGDVARRAAVSQPQLSRVEGRRDHLVSTLRKYVRALGGDVEVVATIGTERVVLRDV